MNNMNIKKYSLSLGTGANATYFDQTSGHQTMSGTAQPWKDFIGDALSLKQTGPGVAPNTTEGTIEYATNANLSDYLYVNLQLNHDIAFDKPIYPHIHWYQKENKIPNFLLQYRWAQNGKAIPSTWNNLKCIDPAFTYTSGNFAQICFTSGINSPLPMGLSDIIQFRILRDNANTSTVFSGADSYSEAVGIFSFDIHYQLSSLGSDEQLQK